MTTAVSDPHTPASESTVPSSRLSRRKLLIRIGCGTLAGGLTVGGGLTWAFGPGGPLSHEARQLKALKNDPMGAKTILGLTAVRTEESELPGWTTWKYPGVHLNRWFQDPSKPAEQLRNEFINYAKARGWQIRLVYIMVRTTLPPRLGRLHGVSHRTEPVQLRRKKYSPCSS